MTLRQSRRQMGNRGRLHSEVTGLNTRRTNQSRQSRENPQLPEAKGVVYEGGFFVEASLPPPTRSRKNQRCSCFRSEASLFMGVRSGRCRDLRCSRLKSNMVTSAPAHRRPIFMLLYLVRSCCTHPRHFEAFVRQRAARSY